MSDAEHLFVLVLVLVALAVGAFVGAIAATARAARRTGRSLERTRRNTGYAGRPIPHEPVEHGPFEPEPARLSRLDRTTWPGPGREARP